MQKVKNKVPVLRAKLKELEQPIDKMDLHKWKEACGSVLPNLKSLERDYLVAIMFTAGNDLRRLDFQVLVPIPSYF
jgi:hypothetical protein